MITEIKSISTIIDTPSAYDHYLQVNTGLKPEDSVCKSLEKYGIKLLQDLLVMIRDYIEVVEYINKSGSLKPLHCGGQGCVKVIHAFFGHLRDEGIDEIISVTHDNFNLYHMDMYDTNTLPTLSSTKSKKPPTFPTPQPAE